MAINNTSLLSYYQVSDLCLGKPPLRSLPISSSTVADALSALKSSEGNSGSSMISLWTCDHQQYHQGDEKDSNSVCKCVGKICMVDIVCYLCKEYDESVGHSPHRESALESPVSVVLDSCSSTGLVKHVEPNTSLSDAVDDILNGANTLVVPIQPSKPSQPSKRNHRHPTAGVPPSTVSVNGNGREYCWLTQDDVISFILSRISLFNPLPTLPIDSLGLINPDTILAVDHRSPASAVLGLISRSVSDQTSVAVLDDDGYLVSEISPLVLSSCDESLAPAALITLSCSDLVAFIDSSGIPPPENLVQIVKWRLRERNLEWMIAVLDDECSSSASSDDEVASSSSSSTSSEMARSRSRRYCRSARRPMVCSPGSSLIAVMIQAIAHRINYVWVIEDDCSLAGIVRFRDILKVFRDQ